MSAFNTHVIEMTPTVLLDYCRAFEDRYDLYSADFYRLYLKGEFVGNHDAVRWAGYWEAYLDAAQGPSPLVKDHGDIPIAAR